MKLFFLCLFYLVSNLLSRCRPLVVPPKSAAIDPQRKLLLLGNGPSLTNDLQEIRHLRPTSYLVGVNLIVNTPLFKELKPDYLFISDPMFLSDSDHLTPEYNRKIIQFYTELSDVDWPICIVAPQDFKRPFLERLRTHNPSLLNTTIFDFPSSQIFFGSPVIRAKLFNALLTSPLLTNVISSAIYYFLMTAQNTIYLYGCDADSFKNIQVNQSNNTVYSGYSHFYNPSQKHEDKHFISKTLDLRFRQLFLMFAEFHALSKLASIRRIQIINRSSFSLIDCFSRSL